MYWLLGLAIAGGAALSAQAAVNGRLGREAGDPFVAALISFTIGGVALLLYALAVRPTFSIAALPRAPWWVWTGGLLGAFYVVLSIVAAPRLGVAILMTLVVGGQMLMSAVIDHFGLLGLDRRPLSLPRLVGILLVVIGVALVRRF